MLSTIKIVFLVYFFFGFMGWGVSSMLFPNELKKYKFWLSPWVGLAVSSIVIVWLDRLGITSTRMGGILLIFGFLTILVCKCLKIESVLLSFKWNLFDYFGVLITLGSLLVALYPIALSDWQLTTITIGNNDAILYCSTSEFLKLNNLASFTDNLYYPPDFMTDYNLLVNHMIYPGHRPGTLLVLSFLSSFSNLECHQIFTIIISVFFSLTPILIGIILHILRKNLLYSCLACFIFAANLNYIYINYNCFIAQILGYGLLISIFMLIISSEFQRTQWINYLPILSIQYLGLVLIYSEISIVFIGTFFVFIVLSFLRLIHSEKLSRSKILELIQKCSLFITPIFIDPIGYTQCLAFLSHRTSNNVGWDLPQWSMLSDALGLSNIFDPLQNQYSFGYIVLNVVLIFILILGLFRVLKINNIFLSYILFNLFVILYFSMIVKYSYGYYKYLSFSSFMLIILFVVGLEFLCQKSVLISENFKYLNPSTLVVLSIFSLSLNTEQHFINNLNFIALDAAEFSSMSKKVKSYTDSVYVDINLEKFSWDAMWATYFLRDLELVMFPSLDNSQNEVVKVPKYTQSQLLMNNPRTLILEKKYPNLTHSVSPVLSQFWLGKTFTLKELSVPSSIFNYNSIAEGIDEPVVITWDQGFYDTEYVNESSFKWSDRLSGISLYNPSINERLVTVSFIIQTHDEQYSSLNITGDLPTQVIKINNKGFAFVDVLKLKPGNSYINFISEGERLMSPDPRSIYFRIVDFQVQDIRPF